MFCVGCVAVPDGVALRALKWYKKFIDMCKNVCNIYEWIHESDASVSIWLNNYKDKLNYAQIEIF